MRNGLGQVQNSSATGFQPDFVNATLGVNNKEIPYDYVATFNLTGELGNRLQDVVNISIEGAFVAVAIGYSFLPLQIPIQRPQPLQPADQRGRVWKNALRTFISDLNFQGLNRRQAAVLQVIDNFLAPNGVPAAQNVPLPTIENLVHCVINCGLQFTYNLVDSGTGRELQNKPVSNLAGLGNAKGDRPFRQLARPMLFMPRSTIRIEIIEQSQGDSYAGGTLYFVFHGYKILGYGTT